MRHLRGPVAAGLLLGSLLLGGCAGWLGNSGPTGLNVVTAPAPSADERYCAWYGDSDGTTLYAGLSPFWSAMRDAGGDPSADLYAPGPQWIGRFDLASETWQEPLDVAPDGADTQSGVWDVHATPDGAVFFTVFFETSGKVDPKSGAVDHFRAAGSGLNELAPGPQGRVLVSRYGGSDGSRSGGELLTLLPDGRIARRWPMPAPLGWFVAPKTPAWNGAWQRLVASTDLLPEFEGGETRHDTYWLEPVLDEAVAGTPGWQTRAEPELQFVTVDADGVEYRAEVDGEKSLWLRRLAPPEQGGDDQRVLLDPEFPSSADFVQDLKPAPGGRVVATRWSGAVHVVGRDSGRVDTLALPRLERGGLYYTAVIHGERLCATYCADATVVCTDLP